MAAIMMVGLMWLVEAGSVVEAYIGLEAVAIGAYVMVGVRRVSEYSVEAALKYYVVGAISSIMILIGVVMALRGLGSIVMADIGLIMAGRNKVASVAMCSVASIMAIGYGSMLAGLFIKVAVVPVHSWLAEVYDGASNVVLALLGAGVKVAVMVWFCGFVYGIMSGIVVGGLMFLVGLVTIVVGAVGAYGQVAWKRMLAMSGVVHTGFLCGVLQSNDGLIGNSVVMYLGVYGGLTMAMLGIMAEISAVGKDSSGMAVRRGQRYVEEYGGLLDTQWVLVLLMVALVFNIIGIPPLVGFHSKLMVVVASVGSGHVVGIMALVILKVGSALYYVRFMAVLLAGAKDKVGRVLSVPRAKMALMLVTVVGISVVPYIKAALLYGVLGA